MRSVSEFSRAKGISARRGYELVRQGILPAEKLGNGGIVLSESAMDWTPRRARPLSRRMAWMLLGWLDGVVPPDIRGAESARIRQHIQTIVESPDPAKALSEKVSARAEMYVFRAAEVDVPDIRADGRVVLSGLGVPGSGMVAGDVVEGYVSPGDLNAVVVEYLLAEASDGNVRLRVADAPKVGPALIAADLAEWGRAREVREANRILSKLLETRQ